MLNDLLLRGRHASEIGPKYRLLTLASWLILALALALAFISWDPYTLRTWYNADNLQMLSLFRDMSVHHYPLTQQSLSQAMYWFPDVLVQGVMAGLSGFNPAVTLMGGGWIIAMATMAMGHACLQRLAPDTTPRDSRHGLMINLNTLISLCLVGLLLLQPLHRWTDSALKDLWFPHMLLWPCFHNGVILITLMAFWLTLKRFTPEFPYLSRAVQWRHTLTYLALILIGTMSDALLVLTWAVPLTLVVGFNRDKRAWLGLTWLGAGLAMSMIAWWQHIGSFTGVSITWEAPSKALLHWLIIAQTTPDCIWAGLTIAALSTVPLLLIKPYRHAGVAWLASIGITLTIVILTQMMQDFQAFRYLLPFMGLGLWILAWAASRDLTRIKSQWKGVPRALFLLSLVGVVYLTVVFMISTRLNQVLHFTPPTTPCLNDLGPGFDNTIGLAEYWVDRPNELFTTRQNVRLLTVYPDGRPRHWLNNAAEWHDPVKPQWSPPIRFIIMTGLDPLAVQATWGLPDDVITCSPWPDIQFWVFNPPRRFANPLDKPINK